MWEERQYPDIKGTICVSKYLPGKANFFDLNPTHFGYLPKACVWGLGQERRVRSCATIKVPDEIFHLVHEMNPSSFVILGIVKFPCYSHFPYPDSSDSWASQNNLPTITITVISSCFQPLWWIYLFNSSPRWILFLSLLCLGVTSLEAETATTKYIRRFRKVYLQAGNLGQ